MSESRRCIDVEGSVTVNGDVVFGDQFNSHHGTEGAAILPVRASVPDPAGWSPGADVTVRDHVYLLHELYLAERPSADGSTLHREARALRRRRQPRSGSQGRRATRSEYAWLRQIVVREDNGAARSAVHSLRDERRLLESLDRDRDRGLPRVLCADDEAATLVLAWPSSPPTGGPCPALDTMIEPDGDAVSTYRMFGLFTGLAGLCDTLARLHARGVAHRSLTPAGIVMPDVRRLALRDLGLATRPPEPGEGPPGYQAPEQRRRHERAPGPHTDVYLLAAVVHHLLTGRLPASRAPVPLGGQVPGLPEPIGRELDAALADDPARRPDARALGNAFRAARNDLSRGNDDVSPCQPPRADHSRPQ